MGDLLKTPYSDLDLIIVGSSLSGTLLAYRLKRLRPHLRLLFIQDETVKRQPWIFHESEVSPRELLWILPLVGKTWNGFSAMSVHFTGKVHAIFRDDLIDKVRTDLGSSWVEGLKVKKISADRIETEDGRVLFSQCVLDARLGIDEGDLSRTSEGGAFHKIFYSTVSMKTPHGVLNPIVMDADCAQTDIWNYFSVFPLEEDTLLILNASLSKDPKSDLKKLEEETNAYCKAHGWSFGEVLLREVQCLSLAIKKDERSHPLRLSEFRHPSTGLAFSNAVELVEMLVRIRKFETHSVQELMKVYWKHHQRRSWIFRVLNQRFFNYKTSAERVLKMRGLFALPPRGVQALFAGTPRSLDFFRLLKYFIIERLLLIIRRGG